MTNRLFHFQFLLLVSLTLAIGCPGVDGNSDAGVEPEPTPTCGPNGEPCTCESAEDDWPGALMFNALDIFAESGCKRIRGSIVLTPGMLLRVSELSDIEVAFGLEVRGDYPVGTNLNELSFLSDLRFVSVLGTTGVTSLSGLDNITNLDVGLHVEDAPDLVTIGMSDLRSIGILEPGSEVVLDASLRLVDLPAFETLNLPDDYVLEAGPIALKNLPRFDSEEALALITQYSELTDEEQDPSPGRSPPSVICGLHDDVGNGANLPCDD